MTRIIDCHVHLQVPDQSLAPWPHGLAEYLSAAEGYDVEHIGAMVMAPAGDLDLTRRLNDAVLALREQDPRVYAQCSVHPDDGADALAEIDRVAGLGAAGLKLHPNSQGFDVGSDAVREVVQRAGERGLPALFDSNATEDAAQPEKFLKLAMQCPSASIVLAHALCAKFMQAINYQVLPRLGAPRNLYLELSAIAPLFAGSPFTEHIAWICRNHGLDRVLWGTDYPIFGLAESYEALDTFGFTDEEKRQITRTTAVELYGLEG